MGYYTGELRIHILVVLTHVYKGLDVHVLKNIVGTKINSFSPSLGLFELLVYYCLTPYLYVTL